MNVLWKKNEKRKNIHPHFSVTQLHNCEFVFSPSFFYVVVGAFFFKADRIVKFRKRVHCLTPWEKDWA